MIWGQLALFVVSFILTALLQPKPDIENARQQNLNPDSFPKASESDPVALVLGYVRQKAPNTIWYGDYSAVAIKKRVKTGLFSKKTITLGYRYFVALDLALCLGPDVRLRFVEIDEKEVFTGDLAGPESFFSISEPGLFGGKESGGGFVSNARFYSGQFDQPRNAYMLGRSADGLSATNVSSYPGVCHVVFEKAEIGESPQLRKIAFGLQRYTNDLNLANDAKVGEDMNPAEALFQILTQEWGGLGIDVADIDVASLQLAGQTLFEEGNGCSVIVTRSQSGGDLVDEILRQIDGVMTQDPDSGRVVLQLVRDDYDVGLIPLFDENDVLKVTKFSRTSFEELVWQVKVQHPQRRADSEAISISQDTSIVSMIGTRAKTSLVSYPFVYDKTLAASIASRERAQLATPLFRITLQLNRNANAMRPGDVFLFSWDDYGIEQIVFRVQSFDLGELTNGRIVVEAIQDIFSSDAVVFAPGEDTQFNPISTDPVTVTQAKVVDVPRNLAVALEPPLLYGGDNAAFVVAGQPSGASTSYSVVADDQGEIVQDQEQVIYPPQGTLSGAISLTDGFANGQLASLTVVLFSSEVFETAESPTSPILGEALICIDEEFMVYETVTDNLDGTFTLGNVRRGVLGSEVQEHAPGAQVFAVTSDVIPFESPALVGLTLGQTVNFEVLDAVADRSQGEGEGLQIPFIVTAEAQAPVRPRNVTVDGLRDVAGAQVQVTASQAVTVGASRSDGELPEYLFELDPDAAPRQRVSFSSQTPLSEQYEIRFRDSADTFTVLLATSFGDTTISEAVVVPAGAALGQAYFEVVAIEQSVASRRSKIARLPVTVV